MYPFFVVAAFIKFVLDFWNGSTESENAERKINRKLDATIIFSHQQHCSPVARYLAQFGRYVALLWCYSIALS